jgi:hypothetical protein
MRGHHVFAYQHPDYVSRRHSRALSGSHAAYRRPRQTDHKYYRHHHWCSIAAEISRGVLVMESIAIKKKAPATAGAFLMD